MSRRKMCQAALSYSLGIVVMLFQKWYLIAGIVIILIMVNAGYLYRKKYKKIVLLMIAMLMFLIMGMWRCRQEEMFRMSYEDKIVDGMETVLQGKIYKKEFKNGQYIIYLKDVFIQLHNQNYSTNQVMLILDTDEYSIGKTIVANGKIKTFQEARNEGNFDEKSYYKSKKIDYKFQVIQMYGVYGRTNHYKETLYQIRKKLKVVLKKIADEEDAGVLSVMILGDQELLDQEVKSIYQKSGISHILVISGLHISLLGMGLYRLLRKAGVSYLAAGGISGFLIVGYGNMAGMGTSTLRAVVMFLLLVYGNFIGRSYDSLTALAIVVLLLLYENPYLITYAGFLLSIAAVIGATTIAKIISKHNKVLAVSMAIQMMTLPLIAYYYYEIPIYACVLNMIVLPFVGMVLISGMAGAILGMASITLGKIAILPAHIILSFIQSAGKCTLKMPLATWITGQPSIKRIIWYYVIFAVGMFFIKRSKRKWMVAPLSVMLVVFLLISVSKPFEIVVLDVGQGDGTYIHSTEGISMFVDGGSRDVSKVGIYRILTFLKSRGIRKITYWFVSHADSDHVSGLKEIIDTDYKIDYIVLAEKIIKDEAWEELTSLALQHEIPIIYMQAGQRLEDTVTTITCLYPKNANQSTDRNIQSLVLLYKDADFTGIFAGDISSDEEKTILQTNQIEVVDFYKATHHGSKYSNSSEWLRALQPKITSISCGKNNSYGHPGMETLERLETIGSNIYITMDTGEIKIQKSGSSLEVDTYHMIE